MWCRRRRVVVANVVTASHDRPPALELIGGRLSVAAGMRTTGQRLYCVDAVDRGFVVISVQEYAWFPHVFEHIVY